MLLIRDLWLWQGQVCSRNIPRSAWWVNYNRGTWSWFDCASAAAWGWTTSSGEGSSFRAKSASVCLHKWYRLICLFVKPCCSWPISGFRGRTLSILESTEMNRNYNLTWNNCSCLIYMVEIWVLSSPLRTRLSNGFWSVCCRDGYLLLINTCILGYFCGLRSLWSQYLASLCMQFYILWVSSWGLVTF
jgi:hypothetical protein